MTQEETRTLKTKGCHRQDTDCIICIGIGCIGISIGNFGIGSNERYC